MAGQKSILTIGNPDLLKKSIAITPAEFATTELQQLIDHMFEIMQQYKGVGLAAPQIGIFKRIIIYGFKKSPRYSDQTDIPFSVLINPSFDIVDETIDYDWEGCLSVPYMRGLVPRYRSVTYSAKNLLGEDVSDTVSGFHARVIQHEIDHLDGILFPQRITDMRYFGHEDEDLKAIK